MAYALEYEVPATPEIYGRVKAEVGDEPAKGMVSHLVVRQDHGLRHITVWDSREDWERFRDERLQPAVGRVLVAAGMQAPPAPPTRELQVVDVLTP
ncbi:MAG: hypothetical protein ACLGI2_02530 [Acidimicrobiia bacterium]